MRPLLLVSGLALALCAGTVAHGTGIAVGRRTIDTVSTAQKAVLSQLQNTGGNVAVYWNEANATPSYLAGHLTSPGYRTAFGSPADAAIGFVGTNRVLFRLQDPSSELVPLKVENDHLGMTHVRLQQTYRGLRITGAQMIVHFARDGSVSSVNGRYVPTPQIEITPGVSAQQAAGAASEAAKAAAASTNLVICLEGSSPALAYEVKLPTRRAPHQEVTVDAQTGAILDVDDGLRYDGPDVGTGPGVFGALRTLNIFLASSDYYLIDATKEMYVSPVDSLKGVIDTWDAHNDTTDLNPYTNNTLVYDPNGDKVFNDNAGLAAAVDAHYFTGKVYDYYKSYFGRNSWDNAGGSLTNVVHYLSRYNNAFWNGSFMTYGDGDGVEFANLAGAFDVICHEITHGVTESTAGLEYRGQSGALNESYSDVMACMADSGNWTIGEDVYTPSISGDALRDMSDPHQGGTSLADPGWQPATVSEYLYLPYTPDYDNGGVHINSGIPNHAAYYIAASIGHAKTGQIYYRTLTHYLTPKSLFIDARLLTLQAAADLYGSGGAEYAAVASGFDNVGMTSNLPRTDELAYDDDAAGSSVYETDANWGLANRLTAPGSSKLMRIEFLYRGDNNPSGNGSFVLKIFPDNNGQPGTAVFTSTPVTLTGLTPGTWFRGDVSSLNITMNGDFYVGLFYDGVNQPMVGADQTSNGRAWEWDDSQKKWVFLDASSYFPVTLFIRAIVNTTTGVEVAAAGGPAVFSLSQNYPNPFNPKTEIRYQVSEVSEVDLAVYDVLGRRVASLVHEIKKPGEYTVGFDGSSIASGVYICRLIAGRFGESRKMVLMK